MRACLLALCLLILLPAGARACGTESDCAVGARSYRIALPEGVARPGALVWAHGYRGSAAGVMRNGSLRRAAAEAGLALIALQGLKGSWILPNGPRTMEATGAREVAYVRAVLADAEARFGLDPARRVASGFSAGGMLVWTLACRDPGAFAGFLPFSGTFWLKPPEDCARPAAALLHTHGTADRTVPLEGRPIAETHQGQVSEALAFYARIGQFGAAEDYAAEGLDCRRRDNPAGAFLTLCLFEGGHSFSTEHLRHGLSTLKAAGRL